MTIYQNFVKDLVHELQMCLNGFSNHALAALHDFKPHQMILLFDWDRSVSSQLMFDIFRYLWVMMGDERIDKLNQILSNLNNPGNVLKSSCMYMSIGYRVFIMACTWYPSQIKHSDAEETPSYRQIQSKLNVKEIPFNCAIQLELALYCPPENSAQEVRQLCEDNQFVDFLKRLSHEWSSDRFLSSSLTKGEMLNYLCIPTDGEEFMSSAALCPPELKDMIHAILTKDTPTQRYQAWSRLRSSQHRTSQHFFKYLNRILDHNPDYCYVFFTTDCSDQLWRKWDEFILTDDYVRLLARDRAIEKFEKRVIESELEELVTALHGDLKPPELMLH
uniref:Uncharacterized protein n=3 Tax=Spongospora subterranea TaxID=70186 RepID=A0A0H5QKY2_9EUKA|eukprot:CRZ02673.1 hypothetical protein [Spongospora subterranea]